MSKLSIYENQWIDLIFENRNQEYGAYQMRRDSVKTSLTALFLGLLFVSTLGLISTLISNSGEINGTEALTPEWSPPLVVSNVVYQTIEKKNLPKVQIPLSQAEVKSEQLINPVIVHAENAAEIIAPNTANSNTSASISQATGTGTENSESNSSGTGPESTPTPDTGNNIINAAILDKLPQFPGGINQFYNYVGNNFEKPELDELSTIRVFVAFIIERDGSMSDIKVTRDPGYGLGAEAIRVLKSLKTKWSPGILNSKPVRTAYSLPIVIEMR